MPKTKSQKYHEKYYKEHKDAARASKLRTHYNLTPEDYEAMFLEQGGRCAICGKHQDDIDHPLAVDHDHVSGKVRGLICSSCNHILGRAGDNVSILLAAIDYLNRGGYAYRHHYPTTEGVQGCVEDNGGTSDASTTASGSESDDPETPNGVVPLGADPV